MASKRRTEWERGFSDGYICAVANIIRTHDFPVIAKDVLGQMEPRSGMRDGQHSRRTQAYTRVLAAPLDSSAVPRLPHAGTDRGSSPAWRRSTTSARSACPITFCTSPAQLTPDELVEMRKHPGARPRRHSPRRGPRPGTRRHHLRWRRTSSTRTMRKWDGTGYPQVLERVAHSDPRTCDGDSRRLRCEHDTAVTGTAVHDEAVAFIVKGRGTRPIPTWWSPRFSKCCPPVSRDDSLNPDHAPE